MCPKLEVSVEFRCSVSWCNLPTRSRPMPRPQALPPATWATEHGPLLHPADSLPWKARARRPCSLHYKVRFPRPPARLESKDRGCIFSLLCMCFECTPKSKMLLQESGKKGKQNRRSCQTYPFSEAFFVMCSQAS